MYIYIYIYHLSRVYPPGAVLGYLAAFWCLGPSPFSATILATPESLKSSTLLAISGAHLRTGDLEVPGTLARATVPR